MDNDALEMLEAQAYQWIISTDEGSVDLALKEIARVDPKAEVTQEFAPGVFLVNSTLHFGEIAAAWAEHPPIFVRHINPVQTVLVIDEGADWRALLEVAVAGEILPYLEPTLPFSVQSRIFAHADLKPYEVNQVVSTAGVEQFGLTLDVRQPGQVVSVVVRSDAGEPPVFYIGASLVQHNLSDWAGGMRRFAREEGQISRSEFKLLEALELFDLDAPICDCSGDNLDCLGNIFASREEAQRCFEYCFRQTSLDIHLLDPNLNGVACENLP